MEDEHLYADNLFRIYKYSTNHYANRRMGSARHYINYITRGHCRYVTAKETVEFKKGDFFYMPMGLCYESHAWGEQGFEMYSCGFCLFPEARMRSFKLQKLPDNFVSAFLQIPLNLLPDSATLSAFYGLLSKLLPFMEEDTTETPPLLEKLSGLVLHNPSARIPELARQCDLAESTLYLHVKELSGKTPNEYRLDVLMAEAVRLLASTDIPVQTIADRLGFSSANYFRLLLKKHTNLTPTQLRKRPRLDESG